MRTWTPDYEPYRTRIDASPVVITVDIAAGPHAPLASHPERLLVRLPMANPRADGLRADEEVEALGRVEDVLVDAFEAAGALYVGRYVTGGYTVHVFYAAQGLRPPPPDLSPYVPGFAANLDADWGFYTQFLYPDRWNLQLIFNRKTLRSLAENGDQPDEPRQIDHFAYFPTGPAAEAVATALAAAGFSTDAPRQDEDGDWVLSFRSDHEVGEEVMAREVATILERVEIDGGGQYDGWGCPVVR